MVTRLRPTTMLAVLGYLILPVLASAQTGAISGAVLLGPTRVPVVEAQIFLPAGGTGALSDNVGRFSIPNVPAGPHLITVQKTGLPTGSQTITVVSGQTTTMNLVLEPPAGRVVDTGARRFTPAPGISFLDQVALRTRIESVGHTHALVQLRSRPDMQLRQALSLEGVALVEPVGPAAWIATLSDTLVLRFDEAAVTQLHPTLDSIRWIGQIEPADRISPQLAAYGPGGWSQLQNGDVRLTAVFLPIADSAGVDSIVSDVGGTVQTYRSRTNTAVLAGPPTAITSLASSDWVRIVGQGPRPKGLGNEGARAMLRTGPVHARTCGVEKCDGEGVTVAMWDGIADASHHDLTGVSIPLSPPSAIISEHGTFVAGIVGARDETLTGDGLDLQGHAPGVDILSLDFEKWDSLESLDVVSALGFDIGTNSWGNINVGWAPVSGPPTCFTVGVVSETTFCAEPADAFPSQMWKWVAPPLDYGGEANLVDAFIRDERIPLVFMAGNVRNDFPTRPEMVNFAADPSEAAAVIENSPGSWGVWDHGFGTITNPGTAKNAITVGGLHDDLGRTCFAVDSADFAGWGPTLRGRIKPDLVAPAVSIASTAPNDTYRMVWSGTSFSTPAVAAAGALLIQALKIAGRDDPLASTIKALLVHGAFDVCSPGPDFKSGWGVPDVEVSHDLVLDDLLREGSIEDQGLAQTWAISVPASADTLRVTLAWDDDVLGLSESLRNDLDLTVVGPMDGGSPDTFAPWTMPFNPDIDGPDPDVSAVQTSTLALDTAFTRDQVNNVEQIVVAAPAEGTWLVRVTGTQMFSLDGRQDYSLVTDWPATTSEVSVAQVIDRTGSMRTDDQIGAAKVAAQTFVELMEPSDEVAVVAFNDPGCDNVDPKSVVIQSLTQPSMAVNTSIEAITATGCTSIGAGLEDGRDELAAATLGNRRAMLVLTDGWENKDPLATEVLPTIVPEDLPVHTISLGPGADASLLQSIANQTGGQFLASPDGCELLEVYHQIQATIYAFGLADLQAVCDASGLASPTADPEPGTAGGPSATSFPARPAPQVRTVPIETGVRRVHFVLNWVGADARLRLDVDAPGMQPFDRSRSQRTNYDVVTIEAPVAGDWTFTPVSTGEAAPLHYAYAVFVEGGVSVNPVLPTEVTAGQCIAVTRPARRSARGMSAVRMTSQTRSWSESILRTYARLAGTTGAGPAPAGGSDTNEWVRQLRRSHNDSLQAGRALLKRTSSTASFIPSPRTTPNRAPSCAGFITTAGVSDVKLRTVGRAPDGTSFRRVARHSVVVRPGPISVSQSTIDIRQVATGQFRATLLPADEHGNPLGPGLGPRLAATVATGTTAGTWRDDGNGQYALDLMSSDPPRVVFHLDGRPLSTDGN